MASQACFDSFGKALHSRGLLLLWLVKGKVSILAEKTSRVSNYCLNNTHFDQTSISWFGLHDLYDIQPFFVEGKLYLCAR